MLLEQPFMGSLSAPYSTKIDFTKLFEQPSLDSSCGCQAVSPSSALCSQWDFSLPALVLQLTSPPTLVLFHLPLGLAEAAAGRRGSPKAQLWVLLQACTAAAPLLWGAQSCACSCIQDRAPMSATVILCWSSPSPSHLPGLVSISIFSLTDSLRTQPWRLVFSRSCRLFINLQFSLLAFAGT